MERRHRSRAHRRQRSLWDDLAAQAVASTGARAEGTHGNDDGERSPAPADNALNTPFAKGVTAEAVPEAVFRIECGDTPYADRTTSTPSATSIEAARDKRVAPTGKKLADFDAQPEFACWVCDQAGLRCVLDERQVWRIGGHELPVTLWLDKRLYYVLLVHSGWPLPPAPKSLALAEVFAAICTGELRRLHKPEMARFKRRALVASRLIPAPERVVLPALLPEAPDAAGKTWDVIADLLTERRMTEPPGTLVPLSAPWLSKWSGVPEPTIRAGKRWLEARGFIKHEGDAPSGRGRPIYLWRVAEQADRAAADACELA